MSGYIVLLVLGVLHYISGYILLEIGYYCNYYYFCKFILACY